jgi:hypothetical protein
MTVTDTLILIAVPAFTAWGAWQGLPRAFIGPASAATSFLLAYIWHKCTGNLLIPGMIILLGPLLLGWLLHLLLELKPRTPATASRSIPNRCGGAAVQALWTGGLCLALMAGAVALPLKSFFLGDIADDVAASHAFRLMRPVFRQAGIIPREELQQCLNDSCSMAARFRRDIMDNNADIRELLEMPEVRALLEDPLLRDALEKNDLQALATNPAIIRLGKTPGLVSKLLKASVHQLPGGADRPRQSPAP